MSIFAARSVKHDNLPTCASCAYTHRNGCAQSFGKERTVKISLIVALGRNRVIGVGNEMPWHIPDDLKYFKAQTVRKPVIMGRRTLQSIGKALPDRPNIVVTRDQSFAADDVDLASNLEDAITTAKFKASELGVDEIMIVGGGQIYQQSIELADRLYLTEIDTAPDGDTYFPDYQAVADWREVKREHHSSSHGQPAFDFVILDRIRSSVDNN